MTTSVTPASFKEAFPAFAGPQYTNPEIQFWIELGDKLQDPFRWGDIYDYGIQLFVAHNLALENLAQSAGGNAPGTVVGPTTSASVDKVSYSRDPSAAMDPSNGHWNLTTYGLRYVRLIKMVGAGPVQVGVPSPDDLLQSQGAWPGPTMAPPW